MDKPSLNIVRAADIAAHAQEFSHPWNPNSEMRGTQLARSVGLKRTRREFHPRAAGQGVVRLPLASVRRGVDLRAVGAARSR